MCKSDRELEQVWVRTPRTHPLDTRMASATLSAIITSDPTQLS